MADEPLMSGGGDHEPGQTGGRESWKGATDANADVQERQNSGQSPQVHRSIERLKNFMAARRELDLTPAEEELYARHMNNLEGDGKFEHGDGSISTLFAETRDVDGRTYLVPRVHEGRVLDSEEAMDRAHIQGIERLPSYDSPEAAKTRYDAIHEYMDRDVGDYLHRREPADSPLRRRYLANREAASAPPRGLMDQEN